MCIRDSSQTPESAGALDGWSPKELSLLSKNVCGHIAVMLNLIEKGAAWPRSALHARVMLLEKIGALPGKVMSYRPLTITSPLYRCWATMRLKDMMPWINSWACCEMYAGIPGKGAVDAWFEALTQIEELAMTEEDYCGAVADIAKFFDQIRRALVYIIARAAGMPQGVLAAYEAYLENLQVYNCIAGGLGTPYKRRCGIPQGCPFSMTMVALIMRPWIILMRKISGITAYILADDVLMVATGEGMLNSIAEAINKTHSYLHAMGARVAPDKSYNFASSSEARKWLEQTWWDGIRSKIEVVPDFRYLGAHINTAKHCVSNTLDERWNKAMESLKRLRFIPAKVEAKTRIIHAKIYAAAMYGIEAAEATPPRIAKLTAAIIDAYRSKNNDHNADRFFATLTSDKSELDPVAQILMRRTLQIRRAACKKPENLPRYKQLLRKYAEKQKEGDQWPSWYPPDESNDHRPTKYPKAQPHPTTKDYDADWKGSLDPKGPIGLLIEALVWNGLVIDQNLNIWQQKEEPLNIIATPYQSLKMLVLAMAARSRTKAEWVRNNSKTTRTVEIDRDATQLSDDLEDEQKSLVRTSMMGGTMTNQSIAVFNEDVDEMCTYCGEQPGTADHIKWACSFFEPTRQQLSLIHI